MSGLVIHFGSPKSESQSTENSGHPKLPCKCNVKKKHLHVIINFFLFVIHLNHHLGKIKLLMFVSG